MGMAGERYKTMIMRKTCNAATREESEIIALRAAEMVAMNPEFVKIKRVLQRNEVVGSKNELRIMPNGHGN
jgi:UDP-glucose 6-dehydrogenase